jgi:hypothetical protein
VTWPSRLRAEQCEQTAKAATNPTEQRIYAELARQWRQMAAKIKLRWFRLTLTEMTLCRYHSLCVEKQSQETGNRSRSHRTKAIFFKIDSPGNVPNGQPKKRRCVVGVELPFHIGGLRFRTCHDEEWQEAVANDPTPTRHLLPVSSRLDTTQRAGNVAF